LFNKYHGTENIQSKESSARSPDINSSSMFGMPFEKDLRLISLFPKCSRHYEIPQGRCEIYYPNTSKRAS
ncbi:hypothetical protein TNCV_3829631, partial [Trichonephila clavipes]